MRRSMLRPRCAPAILTLGAALLSASCWMPSYNEDINDSARLASKLGSPARSFSLYMRSSDSGESYYVPPRDTAYFDQGFWISRDEGELRVKGVYYDSASGTHSVSSYSSWSCPDREGDSAVAIPTASSPTALIVLGNNSGFVTLVRDSYGNVSSSSSYNVSYQIGGGASPMSSSQDRYVSLTYDSSLSLYSAYINEISSTETFPGTGLLYPVYTGSIPQSPAFCTMTSGGDLFMSARLADGSVGTFEWPSWNVSYEPTRLNFIDRQVNGLLSDGRLFASSGGSMTVYDLSDSSSFTITGGTLRFVYERYDSSAAEWKCVFTRTTGVYQPNKSDESVAYTVEIYEIATSALKNLSD